MFENMCLCNVKCASSNSCDRAMCLIRDKCSPLQVLKVQKCQTFDTVS